VPTFAHSVYLDSEFGIPEELPKAGTPLENPYVFDDAAKELKSLADRGLVHIIDEHVAGSNADALIDYLQFVRLR